VPDHHTSLRRTVLIVAALNLGYFGIELYAALTIRSVSLMADSVDFLEDASVNLLIFLALGWTAARRAKLGKGLAVLMALPALAFLWMLAQKAMVPVAPDAVTLTAVGLGALAVNVTCALMLMRFRNLQGSVTKAAFLSARNDAVANIAVMAAGLATAIYPSVWPDIIVGLAIAWMNLDAAHEVWEAAEAEAQQAVP
jgi:Co/Zn/Cd efflux system component